MSADGITITDELLNMPKGWIAIYENGNVILESQKNWREVDKKGIKALALKWNNKYWKIEGKSSYVCFKRGTVLLTPGGSSSDIECLERCIGYYDKDGSKVIYRVNERTGQMRLDVV